MGVEQRGKDAHAWYLRFDEPAPPGQPRKRIASIDLAVDAIVVQPAGKRVLGRPLIAHVTGTADANNVSRWASGRARPDRAVWERLRTLAALHNALTAIVGSESSGAKWCTGANPSLGFKMPADELRAGNVAAVFAAARDLAQR